VVGPRQSRALKVCAVVLGLLGSTVWWAARREPERALQTRVATVVESTPSHAPALPRPSRALVARQRAGARDAAVQEQVVRGLVRSTSGNLLERASVCRVAGDLGHVRGCVLTDSGGRFELTVDTDDAALLASASGHVSQNLDFGSVERGAPLTFVLLPTKSSVSGTVIDATGGPVAEALVSVREQARLRVVATALSDLEGRFALSVAPGMVEISARAEGYSQAPDTVLHAPAGGISLVLAPASIISGRVVIGDTDEGVSGVTVNADSRDGLQVRPVSTSSDEQGSFRFDLLPAGSYELYAVGPESRSPAHRVDVGVGQSSEAVLLRVAPAATLSADVTVAGQPCSDGSVRAAGPSFGYTPLSSAGTARLEGLLPGIYQVDVRCAFAVPLADALELTTNPLSRHWDLDPGLAVRGRVEGPDGEPVANVPVRVAPRDPQGTAAHCASDGSGEFECAGLVEGEYECSTALLEPSAPVESITLSAAAPPPSVVLKSNAAGRIEVSIDGVSEASAVPWQVFARRGDYLPSIARPEGESFVFERLPLGQYVIDLGTSGSAVSARVTLERNQQVARVTLATPPLGAITGSVVDALGTPVVDAWVRATIADPMLSGVYRAGGPTLTDGRGEFTLSNLPGGRYDLWIKGNTGAANAKSIESGAQDVVIRIEERAEVASASARP
jgi:hypothetical protein